VSSLAGTVCTSGVRAASGRTGCGGRGIIIQAGIVAIADDERGAPAVAAASVIAGSDDHSATCPDGRGPRKAGALTVNERDIALRDLKALSARDEALKRGNAKNMRCQCGTITKRRLLDRVPLNGGIIPPKPSGGTLGEGFIRVETEHELRLNGLGGVVARGIGTRLDGHGDTRSAATKTRLVGDLCGGTCVRTKEGGNESERTYNGDELGISGESEGK
jgi:hypothetical protein